MQNLENLFSCGSENAQHSPSHSVRKCDVVCGQVVRRVQEQVDSVIDQWMSCWKSRNTLVLSALRLNVVPSIGKRGHVQLFRHWLVNKIRYLA